jgi:hypothetical protein
MPPHFKYDITRVLLEDLHLKYRLTPKEIADRLGCSYTLILHYFKVYNIKKLPKYERMEGKNFGILTVAELMGFKNGNALWHCTCRCGGSIIASTAALNFGKIRSCGCLSSKSRVKHGMSKSRPYSIWRGIKTRCNNPNALNFHRYGGRKIFYDPRWEDFSAFWEDMGSSYQDGLTIERIDNDKGYFKENCMWINYDKQNFNKSTNVFLIHDGRRQTITEWAKELGISRKIFYYLHGRGLSDNDIFNKILQ